MFDPHSGQKLHPHVAAWRSKLMEQPAIARELALPEARRGMVAEADQTLTAVCFPEVAVPTVTR